MMGMQTTNSFKKNKKGRLQVKDCQRYSATPVHTPSCDARLYIIIAGCAIPYLVEAISENCMEWSCYVKCDICICAIRNLLIHPLIHRFSSTYPFNFWKLESQGKRQGAGNQFVTGQTQRDRQPYVNKFTHNHCNCMPLDCGMKLEYPRRTYRLLTERLQLDGGFELTSCLLIIQTNTKYVFNSTQHCYQCVW